VTQAVELQEDLLYARLGDSMQTKCEAALQVAKRIKVESAKVALSRGSVELPAEFQTVKASNALLFPLKNETAMLPGVLKTLRKAAAQSPG